MRWSCWIQVSVCVCPLLQVCVCVCVSTAPGLCVCVCVCVHCSRCVCNTFPCWLYSVLGMHRIFGCRKWPKSAFLVFVRKTFITETKRPKCCDDANRNHDLHVLVWSSMSAVWTYFSLSEKDPRTAISKHVMPKGTDFTVIKRRSYSSSRNTCHFTSRSRMGLSSV